MGDKEKESGDYKFLLGEIKHLKELLKELLKERDKALKIQRKETERRLANLNGEHENIKQNQAKSVLREIYTSEQGEQDDKIETLLSWKSNSEGKQAVSKYIAIVAVIISAITLVLWIIKMFNK